ncbi:MAG: leucyl aminopeptidase family protein [Rhodospirillales bacterium]|nr:leucyl aminopeptidase family protein [Rhodospirillales bacterium]
MLDCLAEPNAAALPLHALRPDALAAFLATLPADQSGFLRAAGFTAAAQQIMLLPGEGGVCAAVLGLGAAQGPACFGGLAFALPEGSSWYLADAEGIDAAEAALGFCLGAYRYTRFRAAPRAPARWRVDRAAPAIAAALHAAETTWMVRDLINAPANVLGPQELAAFAAGVGEAAGATAEVITGAALERAYPTIAMVGNGSDRAPAVAILRWAGSRAGADAPLLALCGKGVCFDSGGYDLKPSAGMLRMKKDMGGAAIMLGLARLIMAADWPVRLVLRLGCVENSVSGHAMRPLDVIRTRAGRTVEVGNTDAEGRLVLCDLLDEASGEAPALILDAATLTGAARVALGPDLPALFCNDEALAAALQEGGSTVHDPIWRLPLWPGYESWLSSPIADTNNVSAKPMAGAITAALFLQHFVGKGIPWAHFDVYAWNDQTAPARPEGGEAQAMRAAFAALAAWHGARAKG